MKTKAVRLMAGKVAVAGDREEEEHRNRVLAFPVDERVLGRAYPGDVFGEDSILYDKPHPFTISTTAPSQILRLSRDALINIIRQNIKDGSIIKRNLLQRRGMHESVPGIQHRDSESISKFLQYEVNEMMIVRKRVTIHALSKGSKESFGKLINLPDSVDELLRIGNQKFDCNTLTKIVNQVGAEIEDIEVVKDGDHLYMAEEHHNLHDIKRVT